jgi:hypothetical protein
MIETKLVGSIVVLSAKKGAWNVGTEIDTVTGKIEYISPEGETVSVKSS